MNSVKTFLLMFLMTILLMFIGNIVGGRQGMQIALIFAAISNFVSYWFSDKIVLSMYKAQPLDENSRISQIVKKLTVQADLPMPKVYIIEQQQPNAFATGRNPRNAAVVVTRGLTEIMDENELAGVLGHELGHVHNRDILISSIAATMAGAIMMLSRMAQWTAVLGGGRRDDREGGGNPIAMLLVALLAPFAAGLIQMAISRSREYKADSFGAKVSGNPLYLANALRKLEMAAGRIPMHANVATENMFIVNPFSGQRMASLFSTHPSTADRIARLEEMSRDRV